MNAENETVPYSAPGYWRNDKSLSSYFAAVKGLFLFAACQM